MSAGRLQLYDTRAACATAPRACSCGSRTGASCGCASSGRSRRRGQAARAESSRRTRRSRPSGPRRGPTRRVRGAAGGARRCTPCCATSTSSPASAARGSTRSCGARSSRRSSAATTSSAGRPSAARRDRRAPGGALEHYEQVLRSRCPTSCPAAAGPPPSGRAVPALRHDARGGPLRGLRDELLPGVPDGRQGPQGPPAVAAAEVAGSGSQSSRSFSCARRRRLFAVPSGTPVRRAISAQLMPPQ